MRPIDADELWEKMYRYNDNEGARMPYGDDDSLIHKDSACFLIENAPTIEPEQRWIPCSERLPEKEVVYIITVHYDDRNFITFDNFCSYKHGWKEWSNQEVLAWMPLPEPYAER